MDTTTLFQIFNASFDQGKHLLIRLDYALDWAQEMLTPRCSTTRLNRLIQQTQTRASPPSSNFAR